jgi:hypothetical protein
LREQARTCLVWAHECFDLQTATRLRLMADEFRAKADEFEHRHEFSLDRHPPDIAANETRSDDR